MGLGAEQAGESRKRGLQTRKLSDVEWRRGEEEFTCRALISLATRPPEGSSVRMTVGRVANGAPEESYPCLKELMRALIPSAPLSAAWETVKTLP